MGDAFSRIYPICSGSFKNELVQADGREQVIGFYMPGDILGIDGIGEGHYACNAVALEDCDVCMISFSEFGNISREVRGLQHSFHQLMSREMVRDKDLMLLLGSMRAVERLAAFLLTLSQRFEAKGYSASEFNLRMQRRDVASFLGLTLETVSRLISKLQGDSLIRVRHKHVRILDAAGLRSIIG